MTLKNHNNTMIQRNMWYMWSRCFRCWRLRSKQWKQYIFFKVIFRVKVLTFSFGYSQTLNLSVEELNQCHRKSCRPTIFYPMTLPSSWHTSRGGREENRKRVKTITLFLFRGGRKLYGKVIETLNPKEVFKRFPNGLKWLEPTKGLSYLI